MLQFKRPILFFYRIKYYETGRIQRGQSINEMSSGHL